MANKNKLSRKQQEILWDDTLKRVSRGGVEHSLEDLMETTGWGEDQARKFAGMALKHCAVEYHDEKAAADRKTGIIWFVSAILSFVVIKITRDYLHEYFQIVPVVPFVYSGFLMLRGLANGLRMKKARKNLPPPPHTR